jgi:SNF2 family DNA or RNA helicase
MLTELLSDHADDHKVIIWCVFKANYEVIRGVCNKLKLSFVEAHGGVTNAKKVEAVDRFTNDPSVRVFIGHPKSLGVGINLIASDMSITFSESYSLEERLQSEARNHRAGQTRTVTHYNLVYEGTINEDITEALDRKEALGDLIKNVGRRIYGNRTTK